MPNVVGARIARSKKRDRTLFIFNSSVWSWDELSPY